MIEVEKKFQLTEEQLQALLKDAVFVNEKTMHDLYYDYSDLRMFKNNVRLRNRDGRFELKLGDDEGLGVAEEIEDEESIQKYFKIKKPLSEFIKDELIEIIDYKTIRKKYKKGEFTVDIDKMSFGYECIEVELLVEDYSQVKEAESKILALAEEYNFPVIHVYKKRDIYTLNACDQIFMKSYILLARNGLFCFMLI